MSLTEVIVCDGCKKSITGNYLDIELRERGRRTPNRRGQRRWQRRAQKFADLCKACTAKLRKVAPELFAKR